MSDETLLSISGQGISPYSARGLTQTLEPIQQASNTVRTANGGLLDISASQFHKFRSVITCTDQNAPAFEQLWPGTVITVDCAAELSYKTSGGTPSRSVVSGSSRVEGAYTLYRPQLTMVVLDYSTSADEWNADVQWTLTLEEQ